MTYLLEAHGDMGMVTATNKLVTVNCKYLDCPSTSCSTFSTHDSPAPALLFGSSLSVYNSILDFIAQVINIKLYKACLDVSDHLLLTEYIKFICRTTYRIYLHTSHFYKLFYYIYMYMSLITC